ncbi:MAG: emp24/gp25L/p24 family protein [Candidatus Bathyarchaeota archaeon]|nr:emp24/gp25L/p24 family protein [Candidatus Bathyarchaeota archaeon]
MKKIALGFMLFTGLIIIVLGAYLTFFWMKGTVGKGDYDVEGGDVLQLSWYLENGDRTEGGFTVSGGNEEIKFYIKNPSGAIIYDAGIVKTRLWHGFTAGNSGIYSFYFDNQEYASKKTVHASFLSPYEPSINRFEVLGLSLMFVGLIILIYSTRGLWIKKRT